MPIQKRLLEIDGHELAVLSANDGRPGTPVVFIHGISACVGFWIPSLPRAVRDEVRWISVSLPGHAPSRLPRGYRPEDVTAEMFAEVQIAAITRLVGERPVALVGWSTGGFAALNIAARYPERVKSILSISGFAVGRWRSLIGLMQGLARHGRFGKRAFRTVFSALQRHRWLFQLVTAQASVHWSLLGGSPVARATLDVWHECLQHQDLQALADLFDGIARFDIRPLLSHISAPALIAGGDRDPYVPLAHTRALAKSIPGTELLVLECTGHMFFAECTGTYHCLLIDWLKRTGGYVLQDDETEGQAASACDASVDGPTRVATS